MTEADASLLIDAYELTMAQSYWAQGLDHPATFELFWRTLPDSRNFLVFCGLEQALDHLENFGLGDESIEFLSSLEQFDAEFLEFLSALRFTGDVWAFPEGEAVFPQEPVLRVTAPLIEAQVVETLLINTLDFQTAIASKAARIAIAAADKPFVDFGARRAHGLDAAVMASRAAFLAGASATSNLLAAKRFGIPPSGTMAHSYVMTAPDERSAFVNFAHSHPERAVFLIDTFDVVEGARIAADVADELASTGINVRAVRIDSGDLEDLSKAVRRILDDASHPEIEVFVSGELNEYRIEKLLGAGAPIDAFGVGTELVTSGDAPSIGGAYKLVEDPTGPKRKFSAGKVSLPGTKQVRRKESEGFYVGDELGLAAESADDGLLKPVMKGGRRIVDDPDLNKIRVKFHETLQRLPPGLKDLHNHADYEVVMSPGLAELAASSELAVNRPG